jgi:intraflagellar transport protein 80
LDKPATGSIYKIGWSSDGTQTASACGNGHVLFAHVIDKRIEWKEFEATVTGRKTISLRNVTNDSWEKLEFRDRIIHLSLSNNHLVVVTTAQCYVYTTKNWNTPTIFDLRDGSVTLIVQAERQFLLVEATGLHLYSYEGRLLCSPKWPGMRPEMLTSATVSLSTDTIAVRDQTDEKSVHLFDSSSGKPLNDGRPFTHRLEVSELALDQVGLHNQRKLAFVDKNRDLFVTGISFRSGSGGKPNQQAPGKLGSMVQSVRWNTESNMLAALQDARLTVYLYPSVIYVDKGLLGRTMIERDATEFGKHPSLVSFVGNHLSIRRADGSLVSTAVSPYPAVIYSNGMSNRWSDATRLCRFVKDDSLWAMLAAMATHAKQLETAEVAYSAINEADKVHYIQYIKELPIKEARNAEMAVLTGNYQVRSNTIIYVYFLLT